MHSYDPREDTKQPVASVSWPSVHVPPREDARAREALAIWRRMPAQHQLLPAFPPTSLQSRYQRLLEEHQQQDGKSDEEDGDWRLGWLPGYRKPYLDGLLRRTRTRAKVRTLDGRVHTRSPTVHVYVSGFRLIGIMTMASTAVTMPPLVTNVATESHRTLIRPRLEPRFLHKYTQALGQHD